MALRADIAVTQSASLANAAVEKVNKFPNISQHVTRASTFVIADARDDVKAKASGAKHKLALCSYKYKYIYIRVYISSSFLTNNIEVMRCLIGERERRTKTCLNGGSSDGARRKKSDVDHREIRSFSLINR